MAAIPAAPNGMRLRLLNYLSFTSTLASGHGEARQQQPCELMRAILEQVGRSPAAQPVAKFLVLPVSMSFGGDCRGRGQGVDAVEQGAGGTREPAFDGLCWCCRAESGGEPDRQQ